MTSILPDYGYTTKWRQSGIGMVGMRAGMGADLLDLYGDGGNGGDWRDFDSQGRPVYTVLPETPGAGTVYTVQGVLNQMRRGVAEFEQKQQGQGQVLLYVGVGIGVLLLLKMVNR